MLSVTRPPLLSGFAYRMTRSNQRSGCSVNMQCTLYLPLYARLRLIIGEECRQLDPEQREPT